MAQCKVHHPWALFREGTVYAIPIDMLKFFDILLNGNSKAMRCHTTLHLRSLAYGAVRPGSADIFCCSSCNKFKYKVHDINTCVVTHAAMHKAPVQSDLQSAVTTWLAASYVCALKSIFLSL